MSAMTPATERWLNEKLSETGLGPVNRDEEFWAHMWAHALAGAESERTNPNGNPAEKAALHRDARRNMIHAIETLYYGVHVTVF